MKIFHQELSEKKQTLILKSILWNTLGDVFFEET
jgi:hypothetical protein